MPANNVVENVLGTIGTVCWTGQILPQNWKSWREHSTEGLSVYLVFFWAVSAIFLGVYNVTQDINIPLIVQPQLFGLFCALSWTQCLHYTHKRPFWFCALVLVTYCVIGAGFETGMIFISKHQLQMGNARPVQFFGIFASIVIAIGLLPQYWEIWKRREVIGISYVFMAVDMSGALFSLLSLAFKAQFDIVAAMTYVLVLVMDGLVLIAAVILNPRARRRRARIQSEQSTLQEVDVCSDLPAVDVVNKQERTETDKLSHDLSSSALCSRPDNPAISTIRQS